MYWTNLLALIFHSILYLNLLSFFSLEEYDDPTDLCMYILKRTKHFFLKFRSAVSDDNVSMCVCVYVVRSSTGSWAGLVNRGKGKMATKEIRLGKKKNVLERCKSLVFAKVPLFFQFVYTQNEVCPFLFYSTDIPMSCRRSFFLCLFCYTACSTPHINTPPKKLVLELYNFISWSVAVHI